MKHFLSILLFIGAANMAVAQQGADARNAHHRQPRINPLNPNLVAYEYGANIRIIDKSQDNEVVYEITCEKQPAEEGELGGIFEGYATGEDTPEENYFDCAYFDWRPVISSDDRYWYAFTSSVDNTLNMGYVAADLQCGDSGDVPACDHFSVRGARNNNVVLPRWAPDGQSLLYIDGDGMYLLRDLYDHIERRSFDDLQPRLLARDAYYPVWSPDGRHIAYEYSPLGGSESGDIKILDLEHAGGAESENAQSSISELLVTEPGAEVGGRYKPNWSQSGRYFSYLIPSYTEEQWDVRVVEVLNGEQGEIEAFSSISGRMSRAFVSDVFRGGELRSGFPIARLKQDTTTMEALFVIKADQENNNPIRIYPINQQAIRSGIEERGITLGETNQNDNLSVYFDGSLTHVSYVSQVNGAMRIQNYYLNYDQIFGADSIPPVTVSETPRELSRRKAFWKSVFIPGGGQIYKGETIKGAAILGTALASVAGAVWMGSKYLSNLDAFQSEKDNFSTLKINAGPLGNMEDQYEHRANSYNRMKDLRRKVRLNRALTISFGALLAGAYIYSAIDSKKGFPIIERKDGSKTSITMEPGVVSASRLDSYAMGIRFNINLE